MPGFNNFKMGALQAYAALLKILEKAPRDVHGRIPLEQLDKAAFQELLDMPPKLPNGVVFRGEYDAPTNSQGKFVSEWPRHALNYSAGDYGTSRKPMGFLSVYDSELDKLPVLQYDTPEFSKLLREQWDGSIKDNMPELYKAGGAKLIDMPDFALGPNGAMDDAFEHQYPQGLIWDKGKLRQRSKGGKI